MTMGENTNLHTRSCLAPPKGLLGMAEEDIGRVAAGGILVNVGPGSGVGTPDGE